MATQSKNVQSPATPAALKDQRARDAAQAMREYEADRVAVRANIARLRALRLAKEAENRQDAQKVQPAQPRRRSSSS